MRLYKFIFSNKPSIRILRHISFWAWWYIYGIMLFLYNNSNIQNTFWLTLKVRCEKVAIVMPVGILQCYLVVYWLIPQFLVRKKYLIFFCGFLISAATVIYVVDLLTYNKFDFSSLWGGIISYISRAGPFLCTIMVMIKMLKTWYLKEREKEMLLKENLSAELQLLKAQIHPHFLFNTLNNIYSFIFSDTVKAQNHVKKLEKILRYMITECDQPLMSLSKEVGVLNDYAALEKVRYGNNLAIKLNIKVPEDKFITPLLMIPFLENSFKHGTSKMLSNPWIKLDIEVKNNMLYFSLLNSKPFSDIVTSYNKHGIGISNVKKRLALLYPQKHFLKIESTKDTFIVNMRLPLYESVLQTDLPIETTFFGLNFSMSTKKINCLAVDDEPPALDIIQKYIEAIPSLHLTGTCSNAVEAFEVLQNQTVDLIFLDIQMPQLLGTDFIRTLKNPPKIIFTTAFRKFAVEGFELDAVDYLLKPISFERFLKAVSKVMQTSLSVKQASLYIEKDNPKSFIHLRADRKTLKIALDDILFIESLKDYIKVVTKAKPIVTKQSISSLEENISTQGFIRIHRSFIVAVNKIESYTNELIQISNHELPIGRSYRHEVNKILNNK